MGMKTATNRVETTTKRVGASSALRSNRIAPGLLLVGALLLFSLLSSVTDPSLEILAPSSSFSTTERVIDFSFIYHIGDYGADVVSCDLILNDTRLGPISVQNEETGQIRARGFVVGTYRWSIYCNDTLASVNRSLYIDPGAKPSVQLVAPLPGYKGDKAVPFHFIYHSGDDAPPNATCQFWINDTMEKTFLTNSGDPLTFENNQLGPGSYIWYVICNSGTLFEAKSAFYDFTIRKTTKPPVINSTPVVLPPVPSPPPAPAPTYSPTPVPGVPNSAPATVPGSTNPSEPSFHLATLSAPADAYAGDTLALTLSSADGTPIPKAMIKVYGPSDAALVTDANGTARFQATLMGNYTYSVPDYSLISDPTTKVRPSPAGGSLLAIPVFDSSSWIGAIPIAVSLLALILLIIALLWFIRQEKQKAQEERLLHPKYPSPTGLMDLEQPRDEFAATEPKPVPHPLDSASSSVPTSDPARSTSPLPSAPPSLVTYDSSPPIYDSHPKMDGHQETPIDPDPLAMPSVVSIPAEKMNPGSSPNDRWIPPALLPPTPPIPAKPVPGALQPPKHAPSPFAPLPLPKIQKQNPGAKRTKISKS